MSISMGGNAEGFGYHSLGAGETGHTGMPTAQAGAVGISPHPGIGSSMHYVQGLQGESRNFSFNQGKEEGKGIHGPGSGNNSSEEEDTASSEGDAAAESTAEDAGASLAEDAAIVAV